jgi:hypothetical protein
MKGIEPEVPFINILPMAQTDTGEFPTVLQDTTAAEDVAAGTMTEPMRVKEVSDLTEVEITPINAILGRTAVVGYKFPYTDKFLRRSDSDARINLALSKIKAGMIMKINMVMLQGIVDAANASFPDDLSDWDTAIDPRADAIKLRKEFNTGSTGTEALPFELDTCFVSGTKHALLQEYYMSMDWAFDNKVIDVDGTKFYNVKNAFANLTSSKDIVGLDSRIPPGIFEKYTDPRYSTIRQAELADPQSTLNVPPSLINVNKVEPRSITDEYIVEIVAEIGFASTEPKGAVAGTL